jgi:hypothetical protein
MGVNLRKKIEAEMMNKQEVDKINATDNSTPSKVGGSNMILQTPPTSKDVLPSVATPEAVTGPATQDSSNDEQNMVNRLTLPTPSAIPKPSPSRMRKSPKDGSKSRSSNPW